MPNYTYIWTARGPSLSIPNADCVDYTYETGQCFWYDTFANALVRLDIISPDGTVVPQDKKATEGEVIAVNYDDDDNDGIQRGSNGAITSATADKDDTDGVANENDLIELRFYKLKDMDPTRYKFRLEYVDQGADQRIALWKSKNKNPQNDEQVLSDATEFPIDHDGSVWVEGLKPNETDAGEFVTLKLVDQNGTPVEGAVDKVRIIAARPLIAVFGDGPDPGNKLALLDYLNPLYKDHRPQPRMVKESGQHVWYSIEVFGTTGNAGEKLLEMALAADGSYVVFDGHSNFGLGPAFSSGLTSLSAFMNTAPELVPVKWRYLRENQGHPNLEIADSEIPNSVSFQGDTYVLTGSGYDRYHAFNGQDIDGGHELLFVQAGNADVPLLRYNKFMMRGCTTFDYFSDIFRHGTFFSTIKLCPVTSADVKIFVQNVLLGKTNSEIVTALNGGSSTNIVYGYQTFP